jgi:hypothetical protein
MNDPMHSALHPHLPDGGRQMQWFISQHGIRPRLHLSSTEEREQRLYSSAPKEPDHAHRAAAAGILVVETQ